MKLGKMELSFTRTSNKELSLRETLLPYLLAPSSIVNEPDHIRIGEQYNRTIAVIGVPRIVKAGFLNPLMLQQGEFDLSMHISPKQTEDVIRDLNNELIKMSSDIYGMESKGEVVPPSLRMKYDDTMRVLSLLQTGEEKLFDYSFYINLRAKSLEKLNELTAKIGATLGQLSLLYKVMDMEMHDALPSVLPLANNKLKITRNMTSSALSACFPLTSSNLQTMQNGVLIGINDLTGIPLVVDLFELQNSNLFCLGGSGSGKSFSVKTILLRLRRNGVRVYILDPQAEYKKMVKNLGENAQVVDFSPESNNAINPFDLLGLRLTEKIQSLMNLFTIINGGELTPSQRSLLDEALYSIYEQRGISDFTSESETAPTFKDLYRYLQEKATSKDNAFQNRSSALSLLNRIKPYATGSLKCFDTQTKVDLNSDFIVFDISYFIDKLQSVAPPAMFIILDFLSNKIKEDTREKKAIVVDEAWRLLRTPNISEYLLVFAKTARKYHCSLQIITQELGDLAKSEAGASVLANTSLKLILRQDPSEIDNVADSLKLNPGEKNRLLTSEPGHGVLFVGNSKIPYYSIYMPEELEYITTKPSEMQLKKVDKKQAPKEKNEVLDFNNGFYKKNELSPEKLLLLLKNGFLVASAFDLQERRPVDFVAKRVHPESLQHTIFVKQIEAKIREYTDSVKVNVNGDSDIAFIDKDGKKIALEIETGLGTNPKDKSTSKHLFNYDEWYFVVTSVHLVDEYKKAGRVITRSEILRFIKEKLE